MKIQNMAKVLNISITDAQKGWLDVRPKQKELLQRFAQLDGDGSNRAEPEAAVLKIVRQVKKERRT